MPPTLRSSAPNTPSKSSVGSSTPTSTPRKIPHCTKCKRPRAGHPRSGCPYVDSPLKDDNSANRATPTPPPSTNDIEDALGSMYIAPPPHERDEDTKTVIRNRRRSSIQPANLMPAESLMSLDTNSQEIVEKLLQPGMFDDDTDDAGHTIGKKGKAKIVQWQATILNTPSKPKTRVKMPGALSSPSPDTSMESRGDPKGSSAPKPTPSNVGLGGGDTSGTTSRRPQPPTRSMSIEEREIFVSNLNAASHATIYIVPSADVRSIQASAIKLGFHAKSIVSSDSKDPEALLVLGRDEMDVRMLFSKVEKESKKLLNAPAGRLRAAAGGAVVGAVGAWAGLAFS